MYIQVRMCVRVCRSASGHRRVGLEVAQVRGGPPPYRYRYRYIYMCVCVCGLAPRSASGHRRYRWIRGGTGTRGATLIYK